MVQAALIGHANLWESAATETFLHGGRSRLTGMFSTIMRRMLPSERLELAIYQAVKRGPSKGFDTSLSQITGQMDHGAIAERRSHYAK